MTGSSDARSDMTDWFEVVYSVADGDARAVPWASEQPCPEVVEFAAGGPGGRAVVVGCGLGDDAEALAAAGWETKAFDVSPSAVAWCRRRFPDSIVDYRVADLFDSPASWHAAFDAVVEVRTVQSLPPNLQPEAMEAIADLVAPGGTLLLAALARPHEVVAVGPPWAVSERELEPLSQAGLVVESFETRGSPPSTHFVGRFRRPC